MNACIPPCYVTEGREHIPNVTLVTVCGVPHGQMDPGAKEFEAPLVTLDADRIGASASADIVHGFDPVTIERWSFDPSAASPTE